MLRFFRTRAPLIALLLLVALLVTLPGARHPLPLSALFIFTVLAWRAFSRWRARVEPEVSVDDQIADAAEAWDRRHGPPDALSAPEDDEPWRQSLRPSDGWRESGDDGEV